MEQSTPFLIKNFKLTIPIILIVGSILLYGLKSFFRDQSTPIMERIEANQQSIIKIETDILYLKEEHKEASILYKGMLQKIYEAIKEK